MTNKEEVELDLRIGERYQEFSTELLRLSLLALAGVGVAVMDLLDSANRSRPVAVVVCLLAAAVSFATASALALWHKYIGADSVSCHLAFLRKLEAGKLDEAEEERQARNARFKQAEPVLRRAFLAAVSGAAAFLGFLVFLLVWG